MRKKRGQYFILMLPPGSKYPDGWPSGGLSTGSDNSKYKIEQSDGSAKFLAKITNEGEYKFHAYCEAERKFPGYLAHTSLLDSLKSMVGGLTTGEKQH